MNNHQLDLVLGKFLQKNKDSILADLCNSSPDVYKGFRDLVKTHYLNNPTACKRLGIGCSLPYKASKCL